MSTKPKVVKSGKVSNYKGSNVSGPKGMGVTTATGVQTANATVVKGAAPQFSAFDPIKNTPGTPDREAVTVSAGLAATPTNSDNQIVVTGGMKQATSRGTVVTAGGTPRPLVRDAKRPPLPVRDYADTGVLTNP